MFGDEAAAPALAEIRQGVRAFVEVVTTARELYAVAAPPGRLHGASVEHSAQLVQVGRQSRGGDLALQLDVPARCVPHGHGDEDSILSVAHIGKHLQLQIFKFDDISFI